VLSWRYTPSGPTGGFIQVYPEAGDIAVMSEARTGTSAVSAGNYRDVTVTAVGDWSITIRPR